MKAQVQSQIFVYILALVIISLLLLFSWRWIQTFSDNKDNVILAQLQKELKQSISKISYHPGDIEKKTLSLPSGYTEACFVDKDAETVDETDLPTDIPPLIRDSVIAGDPANAFLAGDSIQPLGDIGVIDLVDDDPTDPTLIECFPVDSGKIIIRLESKGDSVMVSEWAI
ncbi:MAG: hypothetical protein ABIH34_03305 [Nanoarchaeota archaeon]